MRDILFKAKRIDNGEWIIGNLVLSDDVEDDYKAIIIPTNDACMFTKGGAKGDLGFEHWHRVDETTICQYTGLTDKNGNKIWENDIVKGSHWAEPETLHHFKVDWSRESGLIVFEDSPTTNIAMSIHDFYNFEEAERIGNIFDNPELLQ